MVEADPNMMPKFDLFPRFSRCANFVFKVIGFFPTEAPDFMSEHFSTEAEKSPSPIAGDQTKSEQVPPL